MSTWQSRCATRAALLAAITAPLLASNFDHPAAAAWEPVVQNGQSSAAFSSQPSPSGTASMSGSNAATPAVNPMSVAVLPFRVLRADANAGPASEAMQQAVIMALNGAPTVKLYNLAPAGGGQFDSPELAIAGAKAAGVAAVVVGTYQASDKEARATAAVYSATGKVLGVASARAAAQDAFGLQDEVARQVREILAPGWKPAPAASAAPATPASPAPQAATPPAPAALGPLASSGDLKNVTPIPFEGSALQRALEGKDDATVPPAANNTDPNRVVDGGYGVIGGYGGYGYGGGYRGPGSYGGDLGPIQNMGGESGNTAGAGQHFSYTGTPNAAGGPAAGANADNGPTPPRQPTGGGGSSGSSSSSSNSSAGSGGGNSAPPGLIPKQHIIVPPRAPR